MTILEYISLFLENSFTNKSRGTYVYERDLFNRFIDFCKLHDLRYFSEFNEQMIQGYIQWLKDRKTVKAITINKHTKLLKQLHKHFDLENAALMKLKRLREDVLIPEIIEDSELQKIFDYIETTVDLDHANHLAYVVLINLLTDTGARISELLNTKKNDINLDMRFITLRETKTRHERKVPFTHLSVDPLKYLLKMSKESDYLFFNKLKKRQMKYNDVRYFFRTIRENTGIDILRPHMFRHTLATRLIDKGVPINTVQALLGHADIQTTLRYVHTQFKKHHRIYDRVNVRSFSNKG